MAPAESASSRSRRCRSCRPRARRRPPRDGRLDSDARRRRSARQRVEFLLINHPLDCPVCDKGGECPLQDFSYSYGPNESRWNFRGACSTVKVSGRRRLRPDADVQSQPLHSLHAMRAVHARIDTDAQISIADRGYGSEIATFQEEGVHSLLSGNLMDVCPVGAITTRDYRSSRALGQPRGGRHDLHAVREGLQDDGVDQGEAGMGERRAADSDDAAVQSRGERVLDVRHRPVRLSLDRG